MTRFFKRYKVLLWIVLGAVVVPLFIAAFYNRPTADDISNLCDLKAIDQSAGYWAGAFQAAVNRMVTYWQTVNGPFITMFVYAILWAVFQNALPAIYPCFLLLLIIFTCFRLAHCLRVARPEVSRDAVCCLALLLAIMMLVLLPSSYDGLYWVTGSVYVFGLMASLCGFASVFCGCWQAEKSSWRDGFHVGFLCLFFFCIGGGDHLNATSSVVLYALLALWILGGKKRKIYLLPFVFLLAGYLMAVLAPGNSARQEVIGRVSAPILSTGFLSLTKAIQFIFSDIRCFVFLALCLPVAMALAPLFPFSGRHVAAAALASVALLAASIFPLLYVNYSIAPRHTVKFFMTLCPLLFLNLIVITGAIARRATGGEKALDASYSPRSAAATLAVAAVTLAILCVPDLQLSPLRLNCPVPSVKAVSNLRDGQLERYAADYDAIVDKLRDGGDVRIATCPSNSLLGSPDLSWLPDYWVNELFAQCYGDENTTIAAGEWLVE